MAFDRAKTSLQQVEEKLRKLFNLAGTIGATFAPSITPVVVIGNLDGPGFASFRGRHWAWASDEQAAPGAANGVVGLRFPVDVILTGVWATGLAAGSRSSAFLVAPDEMTAAGAALCTRVAGTWVDQKLVGASDTPPFTDTGVGAVASAPVAALNVVTRRLTAFVGTAPHYTDCGQMQLPAGSGLWFANDAAIAVGSFFRAGAFGRIA